MAVPVPHDTTSARVAPASSSPPRPMASGSGTCTRLAAPWAASGVAERPPVTPRACGAAPAAAPSASSARSSTARLAAPGRLSAACATTAPPSTSTASVTLRPKSTPTTGPLTPHPLPGASGCPLGSRRPVALRGPQRRLARRRAGGGRDHRRLVAQVVLRQPQGDDERHHREHQADQEHLSDPLPQRGAERLHERLEAAAAGQRLDGASCLLQGG